MTYVGLGDPNAAVQSFDGLASHVAAIRAMQAKCWPLGPDDLALQIAVDGLESAALHVTRGPHYFEAMRVQRQHGQNFYQGLGDCAAAQRMREGTGPIATSSISGPRRPLVPRPAPPPLLRRSARSP